MVAAFRSSEERRERLVHSAIRAGLGKFGVADVDDATFDYIAGVAITVVGESSGADHAEKELIEHIGPLLEAQELKPKQVSSLCKAIARCVFPAPSESPASASPTPAAAAALAAEGKAALPRGAKLTPKPSPQIGDRLCKVEDLILMYLGSTQLLLKGTTFELVHGRRYGVVGSNGAGKTTLMERIADGAISQLAASQLRFVHIRHETLTEHADPASPAEDFARGVVGEEALLDVALDEVGFSAELRRRPLRELSGGWRVRLLLAAALAQRADVLLLDEPTNHLDACAVSWLVNYLTRDLREATCLVVSHDAPFLDKICTDIIHFEEQQLRYYHGNFAHFQKQARLQDEEAIRSVLRVRDSDGTTAAAAAAIDAKAEGRGGMLPAQLSTSVETAERGGSSSRVVDGGSFRMVFPVPGKVEGVATSKKTIIEMRNVWFKYSLAKDYTLKRVSGHIALSSRIAIVGPNGAGKSTLMSMLCGELRPSADEAGTVGEVERHRSLRLAYIAQSHMFHFADYSRCTAVEYIQLRFRSGYDEELQKRLTSPSSEEEEARLNVLASRYGKYSKRVEALVSRTKRKNEWRYEVKWQGLSEKQNTFESVSRLRQLGVERMAAALDERLACMQAGSEERPLTTREIAKHLEGFGLSEDAVARQSIGTLSGGQKSKLMIGASFWTKPHIVCLDEPTNFLDFETVAALSRALRSFRGSVVVVSHNEDFLAEVCNEIWSVQDQEVAIVHANARAECDAAESEA